MIASDLRCRGRHGLDRVGEVGAEEGGEALEELVGLERLDPAQHLLAAPLHHSRKRVWKRLPYFQTSPRPGTSPSASLENRIHFLEHVEAVVERIPNRLARLAEQLGVALADVCARVGLAEPVGKGGVEGGEGKAGRPPELEPDREQRLGWAAHRPILEVDRGPAGASGMVPFQQLAQVLTSRVLPSPPTP